MKITDDLTQLSDSLLSLIIDKGDDPSAATQAGLILNDRQSMTEFRVVKWRVSTRDTDGETGPKGLRIVSVVEAKTEDEAAIIFQQELSGHSENRSNSRVKLKTLDPRVRNMSVVIDHRVFTRENLDINYEGELDILLDESDDL